jgi:hypothetical protein
MSDTGSVPRPGKANTGSINPPVDTRTVKPTGKPVVLFGVQEVHCSGIEKGDAPVVKYRAVRVEPATDSKPPRVEALAFPWGQPMERRWASTEASNALYREAMGFGSRAVHAMRDVVPEIGQKNPLDRSKLAVGREAGQ